MREPTTYMIIFNQKNNLINVTRYFLKVHEFIYYDNGDLVENFKIDVDHSLMKIQHQNKTQCKSILTYLKYF